MKIFLQIILALLFVIQSNAQCTLQQSNNFNLESSFELYQTTGIGQLDQIINTDLFSLYDLFDVKANFFMYKDGDAPNAIASPEITDERFPDGSIIFGVTLMNSEFQNSNSKLGFAIPAIIAHEMAHILQFSKDCQLSIMQKELQADFLAGYYLKIRSSRIQAITFPVEAFKSFFDKGDYEFNNPNHHGTKEERLSAIIAGYNCKLKDIDEIYLQSEKYLSGKEENKNKSRVQNNELNSSFKALNTMIKVLESGTLQAVQGNQTLQTDNTNHKSLLFNSNLIMPGGYKTKIFYKLYNETHVDRNEQGFRINMFEPGSVVDEVSATKSFDEWTKFINGILNSNYTEFNSKRLKKNTWQILKSSKTIFIEVSCSGSVGNDFFVTLKIYLKE